MKKPSLYIIASPAVLRSSIRYYEVKSTLDQLRSMSCFIEWAYDLEWNQDHQTELRSYNDRMRIVREADLVVVLFHSDTGSITSGMEIQERFSSGKETFVVIQKKIELSFCMMSFLKEYNQRPVFIYETLPEIIAPIKGMLDDITASRT